MLFTSIFGGHVLGVVPGDMPGMEYATRAFIFEHRVYFQMVGGELVIKAKKLTEGSDVLQLIPPQKLASDLPRVLIENHVHWLNLSTSSIEIRPLLSMWQGDPQDLMVTWDRQLSTVSVDLPRYGLSFFINSDRELESRHLRGMIYDTDQSIGTLFGLVNKLVLCPKDNHAEGLVQRQVTVDIKGPAHQSISYQAFRIDTDLGYLVGNSSLTSNLYRAYLHALCGNPCFVDPLTRKTGTEEALIILRSAAVRSFLRIDRRAAKLLGCIASLTTERKWYPPHLQCMQTAHWVPLPAASQHHNFYLFCVSIKGIHQPFKFFTNVRLSQYLRIFRQEMITFFAALRFELRFLIHPDIVMSDMGMVTTRMKEGTYCRLAAPKPTHIVLHAPFIRGPPRRY
ncbi:hypothetical protein J3A83DRAFT_1706306 [Scleroderma citrinum]